MLTHQQVVTFGFDRFQTYIGPGYDPTAKTKNCQLHLSLKVEPVHAPIPVNVNETKVKADTHSLHSTPAASSSPLSSPPTTATLSSRRASPAPSTAPTTSARTPAPPPPPRPPSQAAASGSLARSTPRPTASPPPATSTRPAAPTASSTSTTASPSPAATALPSARSPTTTPPLPSPSRSTSPGAPANRWLFHLPQHWAQGFRLAWSFFFLPPNTEKGFAEMAGCGNQKGCGRTWGQHG